MDRFHAGDVLHAAELWLAVAAGSVVIAGNRLGINTDTTDMLSPELPFRKAFSAYREAFPQGKGSLVIVVSGPTSDLTDQAATFFGYSVIVGHSVVRQCHHGIHLVFHDELRIQ